MEWFVRLFGSEHQDLYTGVLEDGRRFQAALEANVPISELEFFPTAENEFWWFPLFFLAPGVEADRDALLHLCLMCRYYHTLLVVQDRVMDGQISAKPAALLALYALQERVMHHLYQAVPPDSPVIARHAAYMAEYLTAQRLEAERSRVQNWSEDEWRTVGTGKSAPAKLAVAGMLYLSKRWPLLEQAEAVYDHFAFAFQTYDDVRDWRDDYRRGSITPILADVLKGMDCPAAYARGESPPADEVGAALYFGGYADAALTQAVAELNWATQLAQAGGWPRFADYSAAFAASVAKLRADLRGLVQEELALAALPDSPPTASQLQEACELGARRLLQEQARGWPEAVHADVVEDARAGGAVVRQEGSTFTRAVVADCLSVASPVLSADLRAHTEEAAHAEAVWLWGQRQLEGTPGWRYWHALPPDADSLGQLLQVVGSHPVSDRSYFRVAVDAAYTHAHHPSGAVRTWIVAPGEPCLNTVLDWLEAPPNAEVVANLLLGLMSFDPRRYARPIRRGVEYLLQQQRPEGWWHAVWYCDRYYGTMMAGRVLAGQRDRRATAALAKVREFLRSTQHHDGAWGAEGGSPLQTAFGVLTLAACTSGSEWAAVAVRALQYLVATQRRDGTWRESPYLWAPGPGRQLPEPDGPAVGSAWSSRTVTTAFVTRALAEGLRKGLVS